jgi:hypothetical protein
MASWKSKCWCTKSVYVSHAVRTSGLYTFQLATAAAMEDEEDRLAILGDVDLAGDELLMAEHS